MQWHSLYAVNGSRLRDERKARIFPFLKMILCVAYMKALYSESKTFDKIFACYLPFFSMSICSSVSCHFAPFCTGSSRAAVLSLCRVAYAGRRLAETAGLKKGVTALTAASRGFQLNINQTVFLEQNEHAYQILNDVKVHEMFRINRYREKLCLLQHTVITQWIPESLPSAFICFIHTRISQSH